MHVQIESREKKALYEYIYENHIYLCELRRK